jgi:hypothetical protein
MMHRVWSPLAKTLQGIAVAVRGRPKVFAATAAMIFSLSLFLPVVVLSVIRKPWDHFSFNPWLKRLPEWLLSDEATLQRKIEFLPNLALFWFIADSPGDAAEWGYTVDVTDLARLAVLALLFGAYFALVLFHRDRARQWGLGAGTAQAGAVAGGFTTVFGLSTGACSVVGCGAPVMPVVGLALTGLSSGTISFLSTLTKVATPAILLAVTAGVAYLGWAVGPAAAGPPGPGAAGAPALSAERA